ncbi:hypothetical protein, partial [Streptococcus pneumoniae]|uniref:hypothetical protein n=1 Tax=Streptococcus pneumoniae TaxID=1313 RepID=UPI001E5FAA33
MNNRSMMLVFSESVPYPTITPSQLLLVCNSSSQQVLLALTDQYSILPNMNNNNSQHLYSVVTPVNLT